MNKRNYGTFLCMTGILFLVCLPGCSLKFKPVSTPVNYYIEIPAAEDQVIPARIAVEPADGRAPYRKRRIVVSPRPFMQDSYAMAQWADSPCNMYTEAIISYLTRQAEYVTSDTISVSGGAEWLVKVYIDACDQVKRDGAWYAHTRVKYEIIDLSSSRTADCVLFERKIPLEDSSVEKYVEAQNRIFGEFLDQLTASLRKAVDGE
jgi:ABC-type uncharacterized transport system auxiliary subunit